MKPYQISIKKKDRMLTFREINPHFDKKQWALPTILEYQAEHRPDSAFLQWGGNTPLTFNQVNRQVNRLAHGLAQLGVKHGDKVVIFSRNSVDYILSWFAINKLGAVQVPINSSYKGAFLEHQVNLSKARVMIVDENLAPIVARSEDKLHGVELAILWSPDNDANMTSVVFNRINTISFDELASAKDDNPGVTVRPQDTACIMFTSGTTGPSKGVMVPHAQYYLGAELTSHMLETEETDTYMTGFPFFHANAQMLSIYSSLVVGARCVLYEYFSPSAFIDRLYESGATVTNFIGVTMPFVHQQQPTSRDKGHKLRRVFCAPTPTSLLPDFRERFGIEYFVEAFGMTEVGLPILSPLREDRPAGAAGLLVSDYYDARIVDPETDEELPAGEIGELIIRHKDAWTLTSGYDCMPEKTAEAFRNLWFHTGDAVRRDEDGWFFYVDRIKDALRRRGENISSSEVEGPILQHEAVDECAVIAVPSEIEAGEDEVKACVVLKKGAKLTYEQLIEWCDERMPYFVVPRYLEFCDSLPKTPTQKIQKGELRKSAFGGNTWDRVAKGVKLQEEIRRKERKRS